MSAPMLEAKTPSYEELRSLIEAKKIFVPAKGGKYGIDKRDENSPDDWIKRHPDMLRLTGNHPFNSEAPITQLMDAGFITPNSIHYTRNHGAVPKLKWETHKIKFSGIDVEPQYISMDYLHDNFEHESFPVTLCCAGNRRKEENMTKKTIGFSWNTSACSTSWWTGVLLRDVLLDMGVKWERGSRYGYKERYVCFAGPDKELPKGDYGTSLPLGYVMNEANDVILAFEQNGERLHPDRGYPVRVVIPGYIGGRMVKWLCNIEITDKPSESWYHYNDNRILPSHVDKKLADEQGWWYKEQYLFNQLNINSAITSPSHGAVFDPSGTGATAINFKGYAYSGAGHRITRVELTLDNGKSWELADIEKHERPNRFGKYWCWVFWSVKIDVMKILMNGTKQVAVRAWNEANNTQPNDLTWNVMGMGNNSWFRVNLHPFLTPEQTIALSFIHPTAGSGMSNTGWMIPPKEVVPQMENTKGSENSKYDSIKYSWEEIKKHNTEKDAWVVINGRVYDCTPFLEEHPGGMSSITMNAGEDCSEDFTAIHSSKAWVLLKSYQIGVVDEESSETVESNEIEDSKYTLNPKKWVQFSLSRKLQVSHDTVLLRFTPSNHDADEPIVRPVSEEKNNATTKQLGLPTGNHLMVKVKDDSGSVVVRSYTPILATQEAKEDFSLLIKVYGKCQKFPEGGKMSQLLDQLNLGDSITVKGPQGHITYSAPGRVEHGSNVHIVKKIGFLCGGTGITPAFRIIEDILANKDDKTEIFLIYANRSEDDILLRKQLDEFEQSHPDRLHVWYTVSDASEDWKYSVGFVDEEMVKTHLPSGDAKDCFVGICGPPPMIKFACIPNLLKHGYEEGEASLFGCF